MKKISISSDENISKLLEFLNFENKDLKMKIEENTIHLQYNTKALDKVNTLLSIYILENLHKTLFNHLQEYLKNDSFNYALLESICDTERYNPYIEPLKILLKEYLKDNEHIDLDSFLVFNSRGLQKEIHKMGEDYISIYSAEINNNNKLLDKVNTNEVNNKSDMIDCSIAYQSYLKELNEIFLNLLSKIEHSNRNIKYELFEKLHLKSIDGNICLVNEENHNIENIINEHIPLYETDKFEHNNETLRLTIIILLCIIIFKTKFIVFHKSVSEEIISQILLYLYDLKETNPSIDKVNLFKCNSCDFC